MRLRHRAGLIATLLGLSAPVSGLQETPHDKGNDEGSTVLEVKDASGKPRVRIHETLIGFNDPSMNEESFISSHDGKRVAYMVMAGDGLAVVADGVQGEVFEGIAFDSLVFSPDGKHLAYVGTRPGVQCVVLDGKSHEYRGVSRQGVVFSPDSSRVGWVAVQDGKHHAVIDGVESPPYDAIAAAGIVFSPDGKHYGFEANSGGQHLVVVDGEDGPLFDNVAGLKFTPHGRHFVYVAIREGKRYAVVDTNVFGPFDDLRTLGSRGASDPSNPPMLDVFEISADGSKVGFLAARGKEWFAIVEGREYGPYENCVGLALSPEGSRVAFMATRGEGWMMVVDGREQSASGMQSLSFSPDGKRLASVQKRGERRVAVIDGVAGKEYDQIDDPGVRFGADGKRTAYVAELAGERFVVVDGVEGPRFKRLGRQPLSFIPKTSRVLYSVRRGEREALVVDGVEGPAVQAHRTLTFSEDGSRYAYAAEYEDDSWTVVVDGIEYGPGGKLAPGETRRFKTLAKRTPLFSPDGKRVAWAGNRGDGWVAVVDGVESQSYGLIVGTALDFSPDGKHIAFVGAREGKKMIVLDGFEIDNGWDGFLKKSDLLWDGSERFSIRGSRSPKYLLIEIELLEGARTR